MEHGASERVMEQSHLKMTIKMEVEEVVQSPAYSDMTINLNDVKREPASADLMKSEPGLSIKIEAVEDGWQDIDEQHSVQAASTPAVVGSMNVSAGNADLGGVLNIKENLGATDIEPTVVQQVDTQDRTDQPDTSIVKQVNAINDDDNDCVLCRREKEISKAEWRDAQPIKEAQPIQVEQSRPLGCDKCAKTDRQSSNLATSCKCVPETGSYKGAQCNVKCKFKECLVTYVRNADSKQQYDCSICKEMCESKLALYMHIAYCHGPKIKKRWLTSAEKMRAFRQRQREKKMAENSSVQEVPQDDFVNKDPEESFDRPTTSIDCSTMNKKPRLTSAEKVRAYRQRQREKRIMENSTSPQDDCGNNESDKLFVRPTTSTDSSTMNKKPRLTSAEKVRAYRQRQREKRIMENSSSLQDDCGNNESKQSYVRPTTSTDSSTMSKKPRLTSAEKVRAYRQRQREKRIMENSSSLQDDCGNNESEQSYVRPTTSTDSSTMSKKPRLTSAEKVRAYRQRQREKRIMENYSSLQDDCGNNESEQSYVRPTTSIDSSTMSKKPRLTSAEKVRAYRQRQREKRMTQNVTISQDDFGNKDSEQSYVRPNTSIDSSTMSKKPRLTSAEKVRAFRQRQQEKRLTENSSVQEVPQDDFDNKDSEQSNNRPTTTCDSSMINKKPALTSAERMRAYRRRQREKRMIINSSIATPHRNDI